MDSFMKYVTFVVILGIYVALVLIISQSSGLFKREGFFKREKTSIQSSVGANFTPLKTIAIGRPLLSAAVNPD